MCAGTVVTPPGSTSAATVSITSRSRSVALKASLERSARRSTLARIGMVLRRSTTRCTWDSDLRSSERSTVTFMGNPARYELARRRGGHRFQRAVWLSGYRSAAPTARPNRSFGRTQDVRPDSTFAPVALQKMHQYQQTGSVGAAGPAPRSFLQLAFQRLDFGGQRVVGADQPLDLAHRM